MKKYLVIGNPIDHSLSPKLHNYWLKENNINGTYEKKNISLDEIKNIITEIKNKEIFGINVTVPFKKKVIPYLDKLSEEASITQSVNTIYLENNNVVGHNTDTFGFESSLGNIKFDLKNKKVFILGAGGVVPSIIYSLLKMKCKKIILSNRTIEKAQEVKKRFKEIEVIKWGEIPKFDIVINATSIGLKGDSLKLNFNVSNKVFYDVIYNPRETEFLKKAKESGNKIENGKLMFIYQGNQSFFIWNNIIPKIDEEVLNII